MKTFRRFCTVVLLLTSVAFGSVIRVPQDQPTIQDGINAAQNGDIVLVSPGTYYENLSFNGKAITVRSSNGPTVTTINGGGGHNFVVIFESGEMLTSVLYGFTIENGVSGIYLGSSGATIAGNIIEENGCGGGAGIQGSFAWPLIQGNIIRNNSQGSDCPGGGGISLLGMPYENQGSVQITGNQIHNNKAQGNGGGISLSNVGMATIENNIIMATPQVTLVLAVEYFSATPLRR